MDDENRVDVSNEPSDNSRDEVEKAFLSLFERVCDLGDVVNEGIAEHELAELMEMSPTEPIGHVDVLSQPDQLPPDLMNLFEGDNHILNWANEMENWTKETASATSMPQLEGDTSFGTETQRSYLEQPIALNNQETLNSNSSHYGGQLTKIQSLTVISSQSPASQSPTEDAEVRIEQQYPSVMASELSPVPTNGSSSRGCRQHNTSQRIISQGQRKKKAEKRDKRELEAEKRRNQVLKLNRSQATSKRSPNAQSLQSEVHHSEPSGDFVAAEVGEFKMVLEEHKTTLNDITTTERPQETLAPISMRKIEKLSQPTGKRLRGFVAVIIDTNNAILMIPATDDSDEEMIRVTNKTDVADTNMSMDCNTLLLTQEVWILEVSQASGIVKNRPTWSSARWLARKIMPQNFNGQRKSTIAFIYRLLPNGLLPLISEETPDGFSVTQGQLPISLKGRRETPSPGNMFLAQSYMMREGTILRKNEDTDVFVVDPQYQPPKPTIDKNGITQFPRHAIPRLTGLTTLERATVEDIKLCQSKCSSMKNPEKNDYRLYVGKASSAMAALDRYVRRTKAEKTVVRSNAKILKNEKGVFTTEFGFSCNPSDEDEMEAWAVGATTSAVFEGSKPFITAVHVRQCSIIKKEARVILEFPSTSEKFLEAWTAVAVDVEVKYGSHDDKDNNIHKAIKSNFETFAKSDIFKQYVMAKKPRRVERKVTNDQRTIGKVVLDDHQAEALENVLYSSGISLVQAPPGSGKTALVAAVTRETLARKEASTIIITGTTNIAVDNALATLVSISENSTNIRPIRVVSQAATTQATEEERTLFAIDKAMIFEHFISSEVQRRHLVELRDRIKTLENEAEQEAATSAEVVSRYMAIKEAKDDLVDTFTTYFAPNVIATTTSLLLRNRSKPAYCDATHILIDEGSQLSPQELLAILAAFPRLKKVAIIGDQHQLQPYSPLAEGTDAGRCFGTPDLKRLNNQESDATTRLRKIYRSHPLMTTNLLNTFYAYPLEAGVVAEDRPMADRLKMPRCVDGTPVKAFHVAGREEKGCNVREAEAINLFIRDLMKSGAKAEDILVMTFHRNQRTLIERMVPDRVAVKTVDSSQGQQAAITIVATTKTTDSRNPEAIIKALQFVANRNRATVAMSRGLEATYVFGNLSQLERTAFWAPVVRAIRMRQGTSDAYISQKSTTNDAKRRRH